MPDYVKRFLEVYEVVEQVVRCSRCFSMMIQLLKICATVLHLGLKPVCSSTSSSPAFALSQLRITQSMILLGWLIRLMVQQF